MFIKKRGILFSIDVRANDKEEISKGQDYDSTQVSKDLDVVKRTHCQSNVVSCLGE